jgi:hypothetical protein
MAILIEEQQDTIDHAALQAEATHRDLERGWVQFYIIHATASFIVDFFV